MGKRRWVRFGPDRYLPWAMTEGEKDEHGLTIWLPTYGGASAKRQAVRLMKILEGALMGKKMKAAPMPKGGKGKVMKGAKKGKC